MPALLDTHSFLWLASDESRLSAATVALDAYGIDRIG